MIIKSFHVQKIMIDPRHHNPWPCSHLLFLEITVLSQELNQKKNIGSLIILGSHDSSL